MLHNFGATLSQRRYTFGFWTVLALVAGELSACNGLTYPVHNFWCYFSQRRHTARNWPEKKRKVKTRILIYLLCSLCSCPPFGRDRLGQTKQRERESSCCGFRVVPGLLVPGMHVDSGREEKERGGGREAHRGDGGGPEGEGKGWQFA